jgi:hypothetical protein
VNEGGVDILHVAYHSIAFFFILELDWSSGFFGGEDGIPMAFFLYMYARSEPNHTYFARTPADGCEQTTK